MTKIISICSGKGGVGKTSVAINLAAALHKLNKSVIIVDTNITTSHIGLLFGDYSNKTLNNFLRGEARLDQTIHMHVSGLRIVPASLDLGDLENINYDNMKDDIRKEFYNYDFVILDSAPGIGKEALISLKACDEVIFVATPHITSVVDVLKMKNLSGILGFGVSGIVLNRVRGKKYELSQNDVFRFADMPVIAEIPEDERILESTNSRTISLLSFPKAMSTKAFYVLAHRIAGLPLYDYRKPFF